MSRPLYASELALLLSRAAPESTIYAVDQFGATHSPVIGAYIDDDGDEGTVVIHIEVGDA